MRQTKGQNEAVTKLPFVNSQQETLLKHFTTRLLLYPLTDAGANPLKRWTQSRFSSSFKHTLARRRDFILNACKTTGGEK